jgi:tetratricopeptide (TPR) repeat protein
MLKALVLVLISSVPSAPAGPLQRAAVMIEQGRYQEAGPLLEGALSNPELRGESLLLLTRLYNAQEDWKQGTQHGKQLVKSLPGSSDAHYQYAVALRIKMQNSSRLTGMRTIGEYKDVLARALQLDSSNLDARDEEIGFLINAPAIVGGSRDKARQRIDELKALDRRRGRLSEASLLEAEEKPDEVLEIYAELLADDPQDTTVRERLALGLQRRERYREADEHFSVLAGDEDPTTALGARYQLARSRILGGYDLERAIELLRDYIEEVPAETTSRLPGRSSAYWRMGNANEQLERRAEARRAYERALSLDSGNEEARKALKRLSRS